MGPNLIMFLSCFYAIVTVTSTFINRFNKSIWNLFKIILVLGEKGRNNILNFLEI